VRQDILRIPRCSAEGRRENKAEYGAGQGDGNGAYPFHNIPAVGNFLSPQQQDQPDGGDQGDGNIGLDREIHKHTIAAHEGYPTSRRA